jgi:FkbM family methyltransferase
MYLIKEGSQFQDTPHFETIPESSKNLNDLQYLFMPEKHVAQWFFKEGIAEKKLIQWVVDTFIDPEKVFIDIGAHMGTYTWTCGRKAKMTYSFECNPQVFCYLAANIALHKLEDKIRPYPFALGSLNGEDNYYIRSADGGGNGIKKVFKTDENCQTLKVSTKTLDSFQIQNVGFIKIDVEGAEKDVLMGAVETLKANNYPKILFEAWGDWKNEHGVDATALRTELFEFLQNLGYTIKPISNILDMYIAENLNYIQSV